MKRLLIISLIFFICCCKKENQKICGVSDPQENLPWLKDIVELAKNDRSGNYWGSIYAEEYLDKDVIFIDMKMGSGGVIGYWYNCDGSLLEFPSGSVPPMTKKRLIYSNLP